MRNSHIAVVDRSIEVLRSTDRKKLSEVTDDGPFMGADDLVEVGYRLNYSQSRGEKLSLSLCHLYLPK